MVAVTVIVPCHNTERYLGAALDSIVEQLPATGEVVVIDDGSTDGSVAVATNHSPAVRCVVLPHRGIAAARNAGFALARGAVIASLDADDLWPAGSLSLRLAYLNARPEIDYVTGLVEQFISPELPDDVRRTLVLPKDAVRGRLSGTMLWRREVMERVGAFDESLRIGETLDWVARADALRVTCHTLDAVVLRRRIHDANTSATRSGPHADYLRVLRAHVARQRTAANASEPLPND